MTKRCSTTGQLSGETTVVRAAREEGGSEQSIGRWKADFLEAGKTALAIGKSGPSTRETQLEAQVEDLTLRDGRSSGRVAGLEEEREGSAGPFEDLEAIMIDKGMSTSRFWELLDALEQGLPGASRPEPAQGGRGSNGE